MGRQIVVRGLVGLVVLGGGGWARAQSAPAGGPTPLSMANPALNPYLNPYLNPMIANQRPMTGQDAAMYLYMANSARGGLGSGQLSGTRPMPTGPTGPTGAALATNRAAGGVGAAKAAAPGGLRSRLGLGTTPSRGKLPPGEMPNSASTPGSGAARFFNPGGGAPRGASNYFGRTDMYINNNRR